MVALRHLLKYLTHGPLWWPHWIWSVETRTYSWVTFIYFPLVLWPIHSAILHSQKRHTYVDRLTLNKTTKKSHYQMLPEWEIDTKPLWTDEFLRNVHGWQYHQVLCFPNPAGTENQKEDIAGRLIICYSQSSRYFGYLPSDKKLFDVLCVLCWGGEESLVHKAKSVKFLCSVCGPA